MSRKARHRYIFDKAKEAAIAAISCYNQPNFSYREESFCILMVNAWELILKAKIVKDSGENLRSIYVIDEKAKRKDGQPYARPRYIINAAGVHTTIGFNQLLANHEFLDQNLKKQLEILFTFRNSAVHSANLAESGLGNIVLEVFTATLRSFQLICKQWFNEKATDNLMLIPLAFDVLNNFSADMSNKEAQNLLSFIAGQEQNLRDDSEHSIRVNVQVKFERSKKGLPVNVVKNRGTPITIDSEDQFRKQYPWRYEDDLLPSLKQKYPDFKQSQTFNKVMSELKKGGQFCGERYLDWNKKQGAKKWFYSPNIIKPIAEKLNLQ